MARNKRPALTSPWKIGFFVSLLLVAVSVGVGYFITRSFGVTWSWIEFHGTWTEFTFHKDAFMVEMLPISGLVTVMALLAYLSITSAVRKYRQFLDSGLDYKRLVKSLGQISDLNDEAEIRKLTSHPELRTFLLNLRSGVMDRQKALDAREAVLADREADASQVDILASEVDVLISAIIAGSDGGFQSDLAITVPELKRVERALREHMVDTSADRAEEQINEMRADLERSTAALHTRLDEIRDELTQSEQNARELESEVGALRAHATAAAPPTGNDSAERAVGRLDSISDVLKSLGEETRSVAITTALRASSSDASVEGVVQLADDIRDVAAKFNGVAAEWDEASKEARQAFTSQGQAGGASPRMAESLDTLSNKVALWAERAVILAEKVKTFEQHFDDALASATRSGATEPGKETMEPGDWGLETTLVRPSAIAIETSSEVDAGADIGIEKQKGMFSEIAGAGDDQPAMFADIPATEVPAEVVADDTDDVEEAPNAPAEYIIDEEPAGEPFYTSSAIDEVIAGPQPSGETAAAPRIELDAPATATLAEEDVIDLYDLGAVEYEPENIHHNA